jgi:uncharacterized damage-inducible protein DinB
MVNLRHALGQESYPIDLPSIVEKTRHFHHEGRRLSSLDDNRRMTFDVLQTLVDYHYWARDRLFPAVETLSEEQLRRPLGNSFSSVFDTMVHLYGADWIWRSRWDGESPMALPSPTLYEDLSKVREVWTDEESRIRAIVARLGPEGITCPIEYTGWDKRRQAQPFWQMLQHLVNHGSYHRGQVTTMLRQLNAPPAKSMDLIAFYRERGSGVI